MSARGVAAPAGGIGERAHDVQQRVGVPELLGVEALALALLDARRGRRPRTSRSVVFFGLYSALRRSTRSSGTRATPTCISARAPPNDEVATLWPVRRLNSEVFPLFGRPTSPIFMGGLMLPCRRHGRGLAAPPLSGTGPARRGRVVLPAPRRPGRVCRAPPRRAVGRQSRRDQARPRRRAAPAPGLDALRARRARDPGLRVVDAAQRAAPRCAPARARPIASLGLLFAVQIGADERRDRPHHARRTARCC